MNVAKTIKRAVTVTLLVMVGYLGINQMGPIGYAVHDLQNQPADNGYSPYSMFERCHAAQFHIPTGGCQ